MRLSVTVLRLALLTAFLSPTVPAAAVEMNPALQAVVDGARAEGRLKFEAPPSMLGGAKMLEAAAQWMKAEFALDISTTWSPNLSFSDVIAKIYTENAAGQSAASDAFVGTAKQVVPMIDKGIFRTVAWEKLLPGRITPDIVEGDGRALRIVDRIPGILYNKALLPQIADVASMEDLLKPEFTGKFAIQSELAGFDVIMARWGYDRTVDYVTKLIHKQSTPALPCGLGERIASGEVLALALDCSGTEQNLPKFQGLLAQHIVPDAAQRRYNYLLIPVNAASPNTAILLGLYLSSPDGQKFMRELDGSELDSYPEARGKAVVQELEKRGAHFTDVTLRWTTENSDVNAKVLSLIGQLGKL